MKIQQEVKDIKKEWLEDPCWDIEDTEEFEDYYPELKYYRHKMEKQWDVERRDRIILKASELMIPEHFILTEYIMFLERRIEELEKRT